MKRFLVGLLIGGLTVGAALATIARSSEQNSPVAPIDLRPSRTQQVDPPRDRKAQRPQKPVGEQAVPSKDTRKRGAAADLPAKAGRRPAPAPAAPPRPSAQPPGTVGADAVPLPPEPAGGDDDADDAADADDEHEDTDDDDQGGDDGGDD